MRIYQDIQYNGQIPQVLEDDKIRVPVDAKVVTSKTPAAGRASSSTLGGHTRLPLVYLRAYSPGPLVVSGPREAAQKEDTQALVEVCTASG